MLERCGAPPAALPANVETLPGSPHGRLGSGLVTGQGWRPCSLEARLPAKTKGGSLDVSGPSTTGSGLNIDTCTFLHSCIPRQVSRLGRFDKSIASILGSRPAPTAHCIQLLVELSAALPIRDTPMITSVA